MIALCFVHLIVANFIQSVLKMLTSYVVKSESGFILRILFRSEIIEGVQYDSGTTIAEIELPEINILCLKLFAKGETFIYAPNEYNYIKLENGKFTFKTGSSGKTCSLYFSHEVCKPAFDQMISYFEN